MSNLARQPEEPVRDEAHEPTEWEKNWAMIAHMGAFVAAWVALGLLAPLFVLLTKGKESEFVRRHAVESLNFQINALVWMAISVVLFVRPERSQPQQGKTERERAATSGDP